MKAKVFLSAFTGFSFGLICYFVLLLLDIDRPFQLAVLSGLFFALLLFPFWLFTKRLWTNGTQSLKRKLLRRFSTRQTVISI